jgi:hypothetical protein
MTGRPDGVVEYWRGQFDQQVEEAFYGGPAGGGMVTSNIAPPEPEAALIQRIQELQRLYNERRAQQPEIRRAWFYGEWELPREARQPPVRAQCFCPSCRPSGDAKSLALLKQWLSPEQLAQYEKGRFFDVTGSVSGKRYRIREGRQQNVYRLEDDREMHGLCFVPDPEKTRAVGDVMLAQKIALETDEAAALKVAAVFPVYMGGSYQAMAQDGLASQSYNSLFGGPSLF